ncbi:tetratricopeptide repeat protein [Streptomyces sp. NPDC094143]|uniref:tetratricopeptide repeat protein n=1 Tax=Streptomyces sp. NPDC094143 TaxID=3155310 RepID=UPI00332AA434
MSRLSREKKREQKQAAHAATPAAPIDVHVPGSGASAASEGASVGGVRVFAAPGEEIQQAVLGRLHHIALATGHAVLATVHDERIGYVVPLRVDPDGSSHFTAEPTRTIPPTPGNPPVTGPAHTSSAGPVQTPSAGPESPHSVGSAHAASAGPVHTPPVGPVHTPPPSPAHASSAGSGSSPLAGPVHAVAPGGPAGPESGEPARPTSAGPVSMPPAGPVHAAQAGPSRPASAETSGPNAAESVSTPPAGPKRPESDRATHVLRPVQDPGRGTTPTFPLRSVPEPQPADGPVPTFELRAVQEPASQDAPPAAPQGTPPTPWDAPPPLGSVSTVPQDATHPAAAPQDTPPAAARGMMPGGSAVPGTVVPPTGAFGPPPPMDARPLPVPGAGPGPRPEPIPEAALLAADPDPKPTPARGFDAVAEAVLGDEPLGVPGDPAAPALLAEPVARINEAVKEGRIEAAADLADRTVAQASGTLGPEHPEVLRLRELTAYIAYLAGDPLRAFHLSLDLAGARRRAGDAEGAYGNVRSAATSWRAVRDPALGLELGRDLVGLWTELASAGGPAAEEIEELESARARMGRLTARVRER